MGILHFVLQTPVLANTPLPYDPQLVILAGPPPPSPPTSAMNKLDCVLKISTFR